MAKPFYNQTLGILGGGQLGRMLIQSAVDFNIRVLTLDADINPPCKDIAHECHIGNLMDYDTVVAFGQQVDVLTIEIEHVNVDALETLEKQGVHVYPQPHVIRIVQDKGIQKQYYHDHKIPTADFILIENQHALLKHAQRLPSVQKLRKFGYDGRGVVKLNDTTDIAKKGFDSPSVLESLVDVQTEIAVIVARNSHGEVAVYPPVEMAFHPDANLVEWVACPSVISDEHLTEATGIAQKLIASLQMVGILAVEFLISRDGKLLVNEIAPRPHNSGHLSIEANETSQYEQHLRAILDLPLGSTALKSPAVMVNLLGAESSSGMAKFYGIEDALKIPGCHVHLYGKTTTKPFRKMGHLTFTGSDLKSLKQNALKLQSHIKVSV